MRQATKRGVGALLAVIALAGLTFAATTSAEPVTGGKTVLKLDADTAEGFADMSIGIETTGAGKDGKNGLSWPVKGGAIEETQAGPLGTLEHKGGIAFFTEGGPGVKFTQFTIELLKNDKGKLFAKTGGSEARFIDLDTSKATLDGGATKLKLKGVEASLGKEGAEILSETFDFPFRKGIPMGSVTIKATIGSG